MSIDPTSTTTDSTTDSTDATDTQSDTVVDPGGFKPNYDVLEGRRIFRTRLHTDEGGVATARFRGQVADVTQQLWIEQGTSGRLSLYAEVDTDETSLTEVRVAIVPTGKRVPQVDGAPGASAMRLGSVKGKHVYLLSVDGTADRAAYEAEQATAKAARVQRAQALQLGWTASDDDGDE